MKVYAITYTPANQNKVFTGPKFIYKYGETEYNEFIKELKDTNAIIDNVTEIEM